MRRPALTDKRFWLGLLVFLAVGLALEVFFELTSLFSQVRGGENFLIWKAIWAGEALFAAALATWVARRSLLLPLLVVYVCSFALVNLLARRISLDPATLWQAAAGQFDGLVLSMLAIVVGVLLGQRLLMASAA